VDERTVKREMAKLRTLGWLTLERPARRGRVASFALDLIAIRAATRAAWPRVGSDFEARMRGALEPAAGSTVVPFPRAGTVIGGDSNTGSKAASQDLASDSWGAMRQILRADDPAVFTIWFDTLRNTDRVGDCLVLEAPSAFHATYVRAHYAERLTWALQRAGGRGAP
jgi:hypothetical protein